MLLKDKTVVITGNPYGIGRVSADLFEREGAKVVCIDDSTDGWQPQGQPGRPPDFIADVSTEKAVADVVAAVERLHPRVDVLFNLAGRAVKQSFENTSASTWDAMIGRNLTAAFLCSRHFLPLMKQSGTGVIIHHASIDGFLGNPSVAAYSAGKGGIVPLTHVMAHDLGKYGIRVNCISTGAIRDGAARPEDAARVRVTPSGRTGKPLDVANVALFLASGLASYVNGANIVVDGGRTGITQGCFEG